MGGSAGTGGQAQSKCPDGACQPGMENCGTCQEDCCPVAPIVHAPQWGQQFTAGQSIHIAWYAVTNGKRYFVAACSKADMSACEHLIDGIPAGQISYDLYGLPVGIWYISVRAAPWDETGWGHYSQPVQFYVTQAQTQFCQPNQYYQTSCCQGGSGGQYCNSSGSAYGECQGCPSPVYWYRDIDMDGYGNPYQSTMSVSQPYGYVHDSTDCNDANANVHPYATEVCSNSVDDDCDGLVDEGCVIPPNTANVSVEFSGQTWAPPIISGSWSSRAWSPLPGCSQTATTAICQFQVPTAEIGSMVFQIDLGSFRYWGDASGVSPAPCIAPAAASAMHSSSLTVLGMLTLQVNGQPWLMTLCANTSPKPSGVGCDASGNYPYYNSCAD